VLRQRNFRQNFTRKFLENFVKNEKFAQHSAVYENSHVSFFWGGGGADEIFQKYCQNFAKSFAKILANFHELKISTEPQNYLLHHVSSLDCYST